MLLGLTNVAGTSFELASGCRGLHVHSGGVGALFSNFFQKSLCRKAR